MTKFAVVDITQEEFWKVPKFFIDGLKSEFPTLELIHVKDILSLKKDIEDCQVLISIPTLPSVVKRLNSTEAIFIIGSGIPESVLQLKKKKPELKIFNMSGINASSVADQAIYLTLKATRADGFKTLPRRIDKLSMLVIGTGHVALNIDSRFKDSFKTVTLAGRSNPGIKNYLSFNDLDSEVLSSFDIIVLAIAYNDETARILDLNFLKNLREDAIVINVARAEFFLEEELVEILNERKNLLYLTDLTQPEFYPADGVLNSLNNFYNTPHMGGTYDSIWEDYLVSIKKQLKDYLKC
ncbi:NAD(P)-dependent oxidoreductase [Bacteriovorax sp. Seq25_V]|uniref:NAD(P)-dependent oxidoreductase n=1 Tax=Bacteriovorax sp. Seq25_V TaxID=1201288 RepID=UPI00038A44A6|nr:NAD(P)-dependent oxidoreductase [Bacteriovorax sp. Seq25_V]EQC47693.1 4-phosphoerythronate dehydrogenase [Bacteriovorax sp. Seq25_V]